MSEVNVKHLAGIASLCLCMGLVGCSSSEAEYIKWAQEAVSNKLKDPASAQYGRTFVVPASEKSEKFSDMRVVCGEVNAKNAYGGYTGATRYIVLFGKPVSGGGTAVLDVEMEKQPEDELFTKVWWGQDCGKHR